ncbi:unnamed protein product [Didymodactylos carnosus]|uniref:NHL repeat-containing protein n=1 Tax=Didymodactylos carnosus TaxID=1234261 RepID=A0A8S2H810_9BILA|nr:unnamed protein product [Didymodactylos carnosus]CAF3589304.1 unnamed protein product [Didymodactylos carnosus]
MLGHVLPVKMRGFKKYPSACSLLTFLLILKKKCDATVLYICPGNLKWSSTGTTIVGNGTFGPAPHQLARPMGLFIEPITQILYIADTSNDRIQKYFPNGELLTAAGDPNGKGGSALNRLSGPIAVYADQHQNLYISDFGNQRVQYWPNGAKSGFTLAGNGSDGPALNEFSYPTCLWVDSQRNIFVADYKNHRVTQWPFSTNRSSIGTIVAGGEGQGNNPTQLNNPIGIQLDETNAILYIANEGAHAVTQYGLGSYREHNIYAGIPGRAGNSAVQLFDPSGITFDRYGNLYIADSGNNRIQMFCPNSVYGITVAGTGQSGSGPDQLDNPQGVALDAELNLYVTDTLNNRVQKFQKI